MSFYATYVHPEVTRYCGYDICDYGEFARVEDDDCRILFETYASVGDRVVACKMFVDDLVKEASE